MALPDYALPSPPDVVSSLEEACSPDTTAIPVGVGRTAIISYDMRYDPHRNYANKNMAAGASIALLNDSYHRLAAGHELRYIAVKHDIISQGLATLNNVTAVAEDFPAYLAVIAQTEQLVRERIREKNQHRESGETTWINTQHPVTFAIDPLDMLLPFLHNEYGKEATDEVTQQLTYIANCGRGVRVSLTVATSNAESKTIPHDIGELLHRHDVGRDTHHGLSSTLGDDGDIVDYRGFFVPAPGLDTDDLNTDDDTRARIEAFRDAISSIPALYPALDLPEH